MRICHLSVSLKTGGLERILAGMATHTDRTQYQMDFVAMREAGRFADEIRNAGGDVLTLGPMNRFRMLRRLKAHFQSKGYDVVHTHNAYPHLYGTIAARAARVPVIVNTRHGQHIGHGWKSRFLSRMAGYWSHRLIAVSDDAAALSIYPDGLPPSKVVRIWNGIDVSDFEFRGSSGRPLAVTVARLAPEKDIATAIEAIAIAVRAVPELRLRIIGDGELRSTLEQLVVRRNIEHHVEFLGERRDIPELLAECGFYVSSSLSEGISLTILEAMAVGLPVVATDVGGNREIVHQPDLGLLVPKADPARLAQAMIDMCQHRDRWGSMGRACRQRVVAHFDIRHMVSQYESLYRELLGQSRR